MRFWNCAIAGYPKAAAIDVGGCEECKSMSCATHIGSSLHICKTEELVALSKKTSHAALLRHAKELSGGLDCHLDDEDTLGRRQMGGMHIHLQLMFEDGTVWLVRILRERHTSFDDELSNQIIVSECATLRWLESLDVPTPRLHEYGLRGDPRSEVGVAYMIIDKLPGQPFDPWAASERQKSKVLGQWADVLCTLGKHPLDKIGSFKFEADGAIEVGPIASDRIGTLLCIGPFEDARGFYSSWANTYLDLITDGQLFSLYPIDAYLIFNFLAEQATADHILVDDDFRITGIIDWSSARAVPAYEAFGPSLVSANTTDLFGGNTGLSEEDRALGRKLQSRGASHCYFESDEMRRLVFGPGTGLGLTEDEAIDVFRGLVATFEGTMPDWQEWRRASLIRWANDARLADLCQASLGETPLSRSVPAPKVPRFATCSHSNCDRSSVRGRSCPTCLSHLCAVHILSRHHKCPSTSLLDDAAWEKSINDEVDALLARVDAPELVRVASSLRNGTAGKLIPGKHLGSGAIMGCANHHSWIVFDDGVKWLARIPRTTAFSDIPQDLIDYLVESEYATLKLLEDLGVPAPRGHGFGLSSDPENLVGVSYIVEDAMPGQPFDVYQATAEQKSHVYDQLANILIAISHLPGKQASSLLPHGEKTKEAAIASDRFLSLGKHGPFADPLEYFTSIADLHLDLIADGQLHPEYPREAFLFYRLLKNRAASALASAAASTGGFFLKHVDDKGDHLLVDENHDITAVIDWQFARLFPACEAFGPSLVTADMGSLYGGSAGISTDDRFLAESLRLKGREDLAEFVGGSELARRFHFGLASGLSRSEALGMIQAVLSLLDGETSEKGLGDWMEREWDQAADDPRRGKIENLVAELERQKS
ncbi:methylglyoxal reductase (NADPH-dependent) [Phialemonium atrogriseum]|uniref:Methylglyoxal reductase (NADPH-dependent) n=1 Tax=Phialemonium atrogriseum TaxID=1093897 RepID=A0AAJ0BZS9_9PEZI|nr:methylglyoxal reductase (NADPH-dependent) [Phialemonium atrogriseum]KAK1765081.1 methylglyoxal reductase (NADPH-dependent) [Phialemonium atrogriseum]